MNTENGNVGIGTDSPAGHLDVAYKTISGFADGTVRIGNYIYTDTYDDNIFSLRWSDQIGMGPYSSGKGIWSKQGLGIHVHSIEEFSIKSSSWTNLFGVQGGSGDVYARGNVGIGTDDPKGTLHSNGTLNILGSNVSGSSLVINDIPTARWKISTGSFALAFSKHNSSSEEYGTWSEKVRIDQNGNVGIGTDNPGSELQLHKLLGTDDLRSAAALKFSTNNTNGAVWDLGSIRGAVTLNNGTPNDYPGGLVFATKSPGTTTSEFTDKMVIDANGNVGIGITVPTYKLHVAGGVSYFPAGIATPGYHAQLALSGGGNVKWNGSSLLWSSRIIALPVELNEFSVNGYIDIYCPTTGTITYYRSNGTIGTVACTSSGVPINLWEGLWYVVTPGQANTSDQTKFVLVHHLNPNWRPDSNWLLIAVRNGDSPGSLSFMPTNSTHYTWIAPTFLNGWVNYGSEYNPCGYYKDSENRVYLRGLVKSGSVGTNTAMFQLPAGYRPAYRELFVVETNPNTSGRIDVKSDGSVIAYAVSNAWASLDNLSFKAV